MSNKTDLQALNANYAALITELQGKAVGGGSGSVEACNLYVSAAGYDGEVKITCLLVEEDGSVTTFNDAIYIYSTETTQQVVKNSLVVIHGHIDYMGYVDLSCIFDSEYCRYVADAGYGEGYVMFVFQVNDSVTLEL